MSESRTTNALKNIKYSWIGQILLLVANFASRRVFVQVLGEEYLGLSGLFSDVLILLSLAELGFGNAIIFSLFKPLAQKDVRQINALMRLYRKVYNLIGIIILGVGTCLTPLLPYIINEMPDIHNIHIMYLLYVCNSGFSYFFSYKRSLFVADQKRYVYAKVHYIVMLAMIGLQVAVLYFTQSFILYLVLQLLASIVENIILSYMANRAYPFLKESSKQDTLDLETKKVISKNIVALFFNKIGAVAIHGTSSIITSRFVSIAMVGFRANYTMIINGVDVFIGAISESITSGFGNLNAMAKNDKEKRRVFYEIQFIFAWIYIFCTTCLIVLVQPFIDLWVGKEFALPLSTVWLLVLDFYIRGMRRPLTMSRDGMGIYWQDRYRPLIETILCIITAIILARRFGLNGVIGGSLISFFLANFFVEPYYIFKHGLKGKLSEYFWRYFKYIISATIIASVTYMLCSLLPATGIMALLIKLLICLVIPNLIILLLFFKSEEFSVIRNLINRLLLKIIK